MSSAEQIESMPSPVAISTLRRGTFRIEVYDPELFEGWTDDELWNGWATPMFEYEEARRMMGVHNKMKPLDPEDRPEAWYDSENDRFCFITEGTDREIEYYSAFSIEAGGEIRKLYGVGTWNWTWEEYTQ